MQNIIFEHLNEDITLIRKEKTNHGHKYRFFEDTRKQRETFSLNFSSLQSVSILAICSQRHLLTVIALIRQLVIKMGVS